MLLQREKSRIYFTVADPQYPGFDNRPIAANAGNGLSAGRRSTRFDPLEECTRTAQTLADARQSGWWQLGLAVLDPQHVPVVVAQLANALATVSPVEHGHNLSDH